MFIFGFRKITRSSYSGDNTSVKFDLKNFDFKLLVRSVTIADTLGTGVLYTKRFVKSILCQELFGFDIFLINIELFQFVSIILECQDLVCKILTTDPQKRATLQDIARHPWLTAGETAEEVSINLIYGLLFILINCDT